MSQPFYGHALRRGASIIHIVVGNGNISTILANDATCRIGNGTPVASAILANIL